MYSSKTVSLTSQLPITARKIRKVAARIINQDYIILNDKVIIQGMVHKQLYFVGTDDKIHHMAGNISFSDMLEIPGAMAGMQAHITADIEDTNAILSPGGDDVTVKFVIKVSASIENMTTLEISPGHYGPIMMETVVGSGQQQLLVEETAGLEHAAVKVAEIRAQPITQAIEVIENKVMVQGVVHNQVFYVGEDNVSYHQSVDIPFSSIVEVTGAAPGSKAYVKISVEMNEAVLTSPQKLRLQSVILVAATVVSDTITGVALATSGPLYRSNVVVGQPKDLQHMVESSMVLQNPVVEVRNIDAKITSLNALIIQDKVILQGILHIQIYYVGTDNINHHQAEDVIFSALADYPGALAEHFADVKPWVEYTAFEFLPAGGLQIKNILRFHVIVLSNQYLQLAGGPGLTARMAQIIGLNTKQIIVTDIEPIIISGELIIKKDPIVLSQELTGTLQTQVSRVLNVFPPAVTLGPGQCQVENVDGTPVEDNVLVDGDLKSAISYVGPDDKVYHAQAEGSFSMLVPLKGCTSGGIITASAEVEHVDREITMDGSQVQELITVRGYATLSEEQIIYVVTDVKGPGITNEKLLVRVKIPSGEIVEMNVVVEVKDTDLIVTKKTLLLDVVGEGPRPVDVVVDIKKGLTILSPEK